MEALWKRVGSERSPILPPPRGFLSASRCGRVTFTRPLDLGLIIAPSLVSSAGLSSERIGSPERRWDSGLGSARSGGVSLGVARARSAVEVVCAVARSELALRVGDMADKSTEGLSLRC